MRDGAYEPELSGTGPTFLHGRATQSAPIVERSELAHVSQVESPMFQGLLAPARTCHSCGARRLASQAHHPCHLAYCFMRHCRAPKLLAKSMLRSSKPCSAIAQHQLPDHAQITQCQDFDPGLFPRSDANPRDWQQGNRHQGAGRAWNMGKGFALQ